MYRLRRESCMRPRIDAPAFELLRPTLEQGPDAFRCVAEGDHLAVIVLAPPPMLDELLIAIRLHQALDRGLLVVVA